ncbi:protamine-like protein [Dunckerocampus dactyliophorus]|uniref:protamine-like protein n=1 Tax=Dunckerocampus dactyliophorus TaxID=161453 RepID=UPI0024069623|nr:protamine-like protein [Dunckerocampus dactyliophorus]
MVTTFVELYAVSIYASRLQAHPTMSVTLSTFSPRRSRKRKVPTVSTLILNAVSSYGGPRGVSLVALKKVLKASGYDVIRNRARIRLTLRKLVMQKYILRTRGKGASGSFKINRKPPAGRRGRGARKGRRRKRGRRRKAREGRSKTRRSRSRKRRRSATPGRKRSAKRRRRRAPRRRARKARRVRRKSVKPTKTRRRRRRRRRRTSRV